MTDAPINGAKDLREALAHVIRRYVEHLDIDASTELTTVRIEATGPTLHVAYSEHDTQSPTLVVSINDFDTPNEPQPPEEVAVRGLLHRRG